ncbi:MAG: ABC transporter permease [Anaerolineales bacterium]
MLSRIFTTPRALGAAQAAIAAASAILLILLARTRDIKLTKETLVALLRGCLQVVVVGSIVFFLLGQPMWTAIIILAGMIGAAATIGARRSKEIPGAFWVTLQGIGLGAGCFIVVMTVMGVIEWKMSSLVPVGSMLIANAMNTVALSLDRFGSDVKAHAGEIEAALALGAEPKETVRPYVQAATEAGLIPRLNSLRSLGIVWIPGLMSGMILAGDDPVYAAIYQFVVIAMIFAASGLTTIVSMLLIRSQIFSPAMQLLLRPREGQK